jgi:hypothetical protein
MSTDRVSPSPATRVDSAPWRSLAHTGPGRRAVGEGARISGIASTTISYRMSRTRRVFRPTHKRDPIRAPGPKGVKP